ncbi:O-antigen ligase family protein [Geomonas limicola]|uniref:O-antigen ligase family protein n=1 Tax=Geomonas limicola TaxID=2740186 RepID=UPI00161EBAE2|nr:O-antigen ligase family protein [Geomonas limicola]
MNKSLSSNAQLRGVIGRLKNGECLGGLLCYLCLACVGGGIGTVIVGLSPTAAIAAAVGTLLIGLMVKNLLFPFYFASLCILGLQEVEITPGSLLGIFENVKAPGIPSVLEISVFLLAICFLLGYALQKDLAKFPVFTWPVFMFVVFYGISYYVGAESGNNVILLKEDSKKFFIPVVFFLSSINILNSIERITAFASFVVGISFVKTIIGIMSYLKGVGFDYGDSRVIFIETSDLILVVTILVAIASRLIYRKITWKVFFVVSLVGAPLLFSLVYSNRRNAWLGILMAFGLLFLMTPRNLKARMVVIVATAALAGGGMIASAMALRGVPTGEDLKSRFASISDKGDKSNEAHVNEWIVTVEALKGHPVLGLGFGSEHAPVPGDDTINRHTVHNALLMLYMKMGVFTLLLFLWCMFRYFRFCVRCRTVSLDQNLEWLRLGLFSTFAYWLVTLNVAPSWWYYRETCMMALVMAIVIRLSLLSSPMLHHNEYSRHLSEEVGG